MARAGNLILICSLVIIAAHGNAEKKNVLDSVIPIKSLQEIICEYLSEFQLLKTIRHENRHRTFPIYKICTILFSDNSNFLFISNGRFGQFRETKSRRAITTFTGENLGYNPNFDAGFGKIAIFSVKGNYAIGDEFREEGDYEKIDGVPHNDIPDEWLLMPQQLESCIVIHSLDKKNPKFLRIFTATKNLINARSRFDRCMIPIYESEIQALVDSPDGKYIAFAHQNHVYIYANPMCGIDKDKKSDEKLKPLKIVACPCTVTAINYSRTGKELAIGLDTGDIEIRRTDTFEVIWQYKTQISNLNKTATQLPQSQVIQILYSPTNTYLIGVIDNTIYIWNIDKYYCLENKLVLKAKINAISLSNGSRHMAIASQNGPVLLWDFRQNTQPIALDFISGNRIAYSPDGRYLATDANHQSINLYENVAWRLEYDDTQTTDKSSWYTIS